MRRARSVPAPSPCFVFPTSAASVGFQAPFGLSGVCAPFQEGQRRFALSSNHCLALRPYPRRLLPLPLLALVSAFLGYRETELRPLPSWPPPRSRPPPPRPVGALILCRCPVKGRERTAAVSAERGSRGSEDRGPGGLSGGVSTVRLRLYFLIYFIYYLLLFERGSRVGT